MRDKNKVERLGEQSQALNDSVTYLWSVEMVRALMLPSHGG